MLQSAMRICYTLTSYPPAIGGAQLHFHALARALSHAHKVQVAAQWRDNRTDWLLGTTVFAPWNPRAYQVDGVPVLPLGLSLGDRLLLAPLAAAYYPLKDTALPLIARVLQRRLADVCGAPDVIHNGRIGREGLSYASQQLARQLDVPFVFTPFHHPRWVGWFYRAYIRLYQEADAVIALTQAEKETLAALGVAEERIHVTGMGAVLSQRHDAPGFRARHSIDGPMILFLGQKYPYKNYEAVLAAAPLVWARWPDACFVFIGPRTRHSERVFAAQSDPRIVELGIVGLEDKTSALAACDVFCMPSSQESFGGVFVEAWLMGKPVIGGDIPAVREVIADGEDGFLVSPDPAQIADRITALLADPAVAQRMAEAGRSKAVANFTWDKLAAKTLVVYEGLLR
jgi:glycosyltransferase involved in cell wall biosynthesis